MAYRSKYGQTAPGTANNSVVISQTQKVHEITEQLLKQSNKRMYEEYKKHNEKISKLEEQLVKAKADGNKNQINNLTKELKQEESIRASFEKKIDDIKQKAVEISIKYEISSYEKLSAKKRLAASKEAVQELSDRKNFLLTMFDQELQEFSKLKNQENSLNAEQQARFEELSLIVGDVDAELQDIDKNLPVAQNAVNNLFNVFATSAEKVQAAQEQYNKSKEEADEAQAEYLAFESDMLKEIHKARLSGDLVKAKELQDELANRKAIADEAQKAADQDKRRLKQAQKAAQKDEERQKRKDEAEKKRQELLDKFTNVNAMATKIEENLNVIFADRAKMMARLQGSTEDWGKAVDNVSDSIGFSGIVKKKDVISQMTKLVDSGVAYNVELRAFLAQTAESIASTFSAFDSNLLRIIRLQQADTTAARLGMEATLTKLFNQLYSDTSYLSDASDSISGAILDASATMDKNEALAFEYDVQKWLGSLYSLGMSSSGAQKIAEGINYLATGNVSALAGDTALQTLFAMSASRSGGNSYADLLLGGLNSKETNALLKAMVEYLAEIARSQDNNVTKAAYAELFGMSVTDLSTFASLTANEIDQLYNNTVNYQSLVNETASQLTQISSRMSLTELVNNAIDNAEMGIATTIGGNAFTYATWKALGLLTDYVGEIPIPGILAAGFGISSDIDLLNVAKTAMVGFGALGSLTGAISSMLKGGPSNLAAWDFNEYTTRGSTLSLLPPGSAGKSYSAKIGVGNSSGSDVESVSMQSAQDKAYESGQTSEEEMEEGKEIPKKIYEAIAGSTKPTVLSLLQTINSRLDPNRVFYTAIAGVMSSNNAATVAKVNKLSSKLKVQEYGWTKEDPNQSILNNLNIGQNSNLGNTTNGQSSIENLLNNTATDNNEALISAIEQAIRRVCGYSVNGDGLPVTVTNFNTFTL